MTPRASKDGGPDHDSSGGAEFTHGPFAGPPGSSTGPSRALGADLQRRAGAPGTHVIVSSADARRAVVRFGDCRKLMSWLTIHAAGLPALKGLIVDGWTRGTCDAIDLFARRLNATGLMIRSDHKADTGRSPRGGYVVPLARLGSEVRWFLDQGRVVFLLEPRSPFDDLYSLTMAAVPGSDRWMVEVAGPGFDASDLKRGDVTPHEILEATPKHGAYAVSRERCTSQLEYERSLATRFTKVARLLGWPSEQGQPPVDLDPEVVAAKLASRGETLLLEAHIYRPIPQALLHRALDEAVKLRRTMDSCAMPVGNIAISMSYLGRRADPVFWDVVWPSAKYVIGPTARLGHG